MKEPGFNEGQENTIKVNVLFGQDEDVRCVKRTLENLPHLKRLYNNSNSQLPKGISEQSSEEEIKQAVSSEFNKNLYEIFSQYIQEHWSEVSVRLQALKEIPSFKFFDEYHVELTRYGTGGSYGALDGTVIANIEHRTKEEVMSTIVHEIIHIGIEHLIQEYLDDKNNQKHHWYKERLVDLIGEMYFPGLRKTQNLNKIIIKNVDEVFNTFFPDMETIVQSLKNMI